MSAIRLLVVAAVAIAAFSCSRGSDRAEISASGALAGDGGPSSLGVPEGTALTVTDHGIGPVLAGMSLADATKAVDGALIASNEARTGECDYVKWRGGPTGVAVMVEHGRIARIDVDTTGIATVEGARVGDTEERVLGLYQGRVSVTPHKYTDGHYLTVTPSNPADDNRIVFETENGYITRYRAGRLPYVEYVEGCS